MSRRNKNKPDIRKQQLEKLIAEQKEDFIDTLKHSTDNKSTYRLRKKQRGVK